jgi:hypothetical protein
MRVFAFSSSNLTNIWAGVGAHLWAVSEVQAINPSIATKASRLPVGAFGILYCVELHSFTVPFVIRSRPDPAQIVENVWPEPWKLPFQIVPLGTPNRHVSSRSLAEHLPGIRASERQWNHIFHVEPLTAFVASEIDDGDWHVLFEKLADL